MARTKKTPSAKRSPQKKSAPIKTAVKKKTKPPAKKKNPAVKTAAVKKTKAPAKKRPVKAAAVPKAAARKTQTKKSAGRETLSVLKVLDGAQSLKKVRAVRPSKPKGNGPAVAVKFPAAVSVEQPAKASFFQEVQGALPAGYGDHFISLMICSPYQLYAYWEIQKQRETEALQILGGRWDQVKSVLRVYNLTQSANGSAFFDLELGGGADRWFINVEPDQSYRVEIGLRHEDGRFVMLARSNDVTTPRVTMSDVLDERWMGIDFDRMYALSGGFEPGSSSVALRTLMEERLRSGDTSGSGAGVISSGAMVKKKDRHFWFTLNCELIVYGATAPDAQVTMNGQPVQLRPDGTFTLRYSLPDGKIRLEAKAVSADLIEERTITPVVQRNTVRPEPVIRRDRGRG